MYVMSQLPSMMGTWHHFPHGGLQVRFEKTPVDAAGFDPPVALITARLPTGNGEDDVSRASLT